MLERSQDEDKGCRERRAEKRTDDRHLQRSRRQDDHRERQAEARAGVDAEDGRAGQRIVRHALLERARHRKTQTADKRCQQARQAQRPDHEVRRILAAASLQRMHDARQRDFPHACRQEEKGKHCQQYKQKDRQQGCIPCGCHYDISPRQKSAVRDSMNVLDLPRKMPLFWSARQ